MKTYFTFLERNKLFTFVNVAGLSISLMFACPMPTASRYSPTNIGQEDITTWATACKAAIRRLKTGAPLK